MNIKANCFVYDLFATLLSVALAIWGSSAKAQIAPTSQASKGKQAVDLLITGGTYVTMDGDRLILEDGALATKGDSIVAIGFRGELENKYTAAQTIDARGKLVLPGFINGHTHVPMTLFRGLA